MKITIEFDISTDELLEMQQKYLKFCMENGYDISVNNLKKFIDSGAADSVSQNIQSQFIETMKQYNPMFAMNPFFNTSEK